MEIDYNGDCFEVVGVKHRPRVRYNGEKKQATHILWFENYGYWPTKQLNHHCHNKFCVRISHLYHGTQKENLQDELSRGNWNSFRFSKRKKK